MIPMSCPSCGRRGNVPLDRLNTRMHCKKCDAVFYLDAGGKPVIGEPPSARGKGGKAARDPHDRNEPTDYIGILFTQLARLGKNFWLTVAAGLSAYGLYLAYVNFIAAPPPTATEIYARGAREVATAFLNKDSSALSYMAAPGTEKEVVRWVESHRSDVGDGKATSEGVQIIAGIPPAEINDTTPAGSDIILLVPGGAGAKPGATQRFDLHVVWLFIKGKLVIEGKQTLEYAEAQAAAAKKKK